MKNRLLPFLLLGILTGALTGVAADEAHTPLEDTDDPISQQEVSKENEPDQSRRSKSERKETQIEF